MLPGGCAAVASRMVLWAGAALWVVASGMGPGRAPEPPVVLAPTAMVRFVVEYRVCAVRRAGSGPIPPGLAGLDRTAVARVVAPDAITGFSPDLLVVHRELPGCPGDVVTLAIRGGEVVVRSGRPGDLGPVVARTAIPARGLGPAEAGALENGSAVSASAVGAAIAALRGPGAASASRP